MAFEDDAEIPGPGAPALVGWQGGPGQELKQGPADGEQQGRGGAGPKVEGGEPGAKADEQDREAQSMTVERPRQEDGAGLMRPLLSKLAHEPTKEASVSNVLSEMTVPPVSVVELRKRNAGPGHHGEGQASAQEEPDDGGKEREAEHWADRIRMGGPIKPEAQQHIAGHDVGEPGPVGETATGGRSEALKARRG